MYNYNASLCVIETVILIECIKPLKLKIIAEISSHPSQSTNDIRHVNVKC